MTPETTAPSWPRPWGDAEPRDKVPQFTGLADGIPPGWSHGSHRPLGGSPPGVHLAAPPTPQGPGPIGPLSGLSCSTATKQKVTPRGLMGEDGRPGAPGGPGVALGVTPPSHVRAAGGGRSDKGLRRWPRGGTGGRPSASRRAAFSVSSPAPPKPNPKRKPTNTVGLKRLWPQRTWPGRTPGRAPGRAPPNATCPRIPRGLAARAAVQEL